MNNQGAGGVKLNEYTIETEAKKNLNTNYESKAPLTVFAIRDGHLITAQQQHSSALFPDLDIETANELIIVFPERFNSLIAYGE